MLSNEMADRRSLRIPLTSLRGSLPDSLSRISLAYTVLGKRIEVLSFTASDLHGESGCLRCLVFELEHINIGMDWTVALPCHYHTSSEVYPNSCHTLVSQCTPTKVCRVTASVVQFIALQGSHD